MNREVFESHNWKQIGIQLAAYAAWKASNFWWRTGLTDALAKGDTPEGIAAEAIEKVLAGERAWDPQRGALLPHLKRVVDSLMDHLAQSADNKRQERLPDLEEDRGGLDRAEYDGSRHDHTGLMPQSPVDPESVVLGPDDWTPEERVKWLFTAARGHDDLVAVMQVMIDHGDAKPQAIANRLATSVSDIYNRLKRLRRLARRGPAHAASPARKAL